MGKQKGFNKASTHPDSTDKSTTTAKSISTATSGFAIQARNNGILNLQSSKPPANLEDIIKRHARSCETASPTESRFKRYVNKVKGAGNESTMAHEVSKHMLKEYDDGGYKTSYNRAFTAFPKDVGFNNGLSAPQPDLVEGLDMEEFRPFPVGNHIDGAVLYQDDLHSIAFPHLAGEWKGAGKDMEEARLQSAYTGAAIVYARNQALSHIGKPDPPGHAEVTTFATDGTNINFFAHYAGPSGEDGTLEYHQHQFATANVKDTYQGQKDGRRGLRNEQDHARQQSYTLRVQLKEHWKHRRDGLHPIAEAVPLPALDCELDETSAYEDEAGYEMVEQPYQPTPAAASIWRIIGSIWS
ncbi:uncharacterized protein BP5553_01790 [Venustampulla echinocandica]|uniref:DUF7924 domain-containing protein n=1 Tax=Venustampulla echinocandica TaxID=2656787 RepID=A0A370U220_9HELO|nr:uncharacterized protein BP5553_01790 [Venustampulla echinocandica]RDL41811.1 hypothetical protein BP5553_01790 [Venustampulla echinocandica]